MGKFIDLTGERFGRLLVISRSRKVKSRRTYWDVICDCGRERTVRSDGLKSGDTRSCGCLQKEITRAVGKLRVGEANPFWGGNDLTGQRFGRLLVIERLDKRVCDNVVYLCKCECGNFKEIMSSSLVGGHTKSCGCLQKETVSEMCKARIGELHPGWNHELTDKDRRRTREYREYREWRAEVYDRDNYTCQRCGDNIGGTLIAHHIEGYNLNKGLRTELSNGVTLCSDCHNKFHGIYGRGNNTSQQFAEFMENEGVKKNTNEIE